MNFYVINISKKSAVLTIQRAAQSKDIQGNTVREMPVAASQEFGLQTQGKK